MAGLPTGVLKEETAQPTLRYLLVYGHKLGLHKEVTELWNAYKTYEDSSVKLSEDAVSCVLKVSKAGFSFFCNLIQ